jgi:carbonic anhydrase
MKEKLRIILVSAAFVSIAALFSNISSAENPPLGKQSVHKVGGNNILSDGNKRFIQNKNMKYDFTNERDELTKGQHPHTIVVTCSDSRVAPEYIFDQGLGSLFVVRVAGNVIDDVALGSIEYAAEHLHARNLIVLGHSSCGAVTAALSGKSESPYINAILDLIEPSVMRVKVQKVKKNDMLDETIKDNVIEQIQRALKSKIIKEMFEKKELSISGGVYSLKTGKVDVVFNLDKLD